MGYHDRRKQKLLIGQTESGITWQYEIGQCLTNETQRLQSIAVGRIKASNGLEFYALKSFARVDPNRSRLILASMLRPSIAGSDDCVGCTLLSTGACTGR